MSDVKLGAFSGMAYDSADSLRPEVGRPEVGVIRVDKEASLGSMVRDRRLALGYSLGQLATRVNKTAASIRSWEKGDTMPTKPEAKALASALDLDADVLVGLIGAAPKSKPEPAPEVESPSSPPPATEKKAPRSAPGPAAADPIMDEADEVAEPVDAKPPEKSPEPSRPSPEDFFMQEAPTEAVPVVPKASVAVSESPRRGDLAAEATPVSESENPLTRAWDEAFGWYRRIFDPRRPWIYRIRFVLLLIALLILLRVLAWAVGELWDAIGAVLDSVSFSPTDTPDIAN